MKVSKKQLRKIIQEERARLLRESMTDMTDVQDAIEDQLRPIGDIFLDKMIALWHEGPAEGLVLTDVAADEGAWEDMVTNAVLEFDTSAARAVEQVMQDLEVRLINGDL